ncbi:MAG: 50S ribosomal protein L5 [Candidatus Peribacteria bacterium]|nr:MAG: 50S ribosomal protein L5 [Candidatus Peribacteria bacterium]
MTLFTTFKKQGAANLQKTLGKSNPHQVPKIDKIIVAMGIGSLATRKGVKDFSDLEENLRKITGQQPQMILSKQSISNFKLRDGMPVMLKVTLRGEKAYDFIERFTQLVLPRVRDFSGLSTRKFDGQGNYNIGFQSIGVFSEIMPEDIKTPMGVQICITTTTSEDAEALALLKELGVIFH